MGPHRPSGLALSAVLLAMLISAGCQVRQPGAVETAFVEGFKHTASVGARRM